MPSGGGDGIAGLTDFSVQKISAVHRRLRCHLQIGDAKNCRPACGRCHGGATMPSPEGRMPTQKSRDPAPRALIVAVHRRLADGIATGDAIAAPMHGDGGRCHRRYDQL
jgi:hypothetical protein